MKEITYLVMEIQMDEIIHTNSAATAPSTFAACFVKNQLTLWLRKAAHALSFGTLTPLTSEEECTVLRILKWLDHEDVNSLSYITTDSNCLFAVAIACISKCVFK